MRAGDAIPLRRFLTGPASSRRQVRTPGRCFSVVDRTPRGGISDDTFWFPWLPQFGAPSKRGERSPHLAAPAVLCAAVRGAGGPYRLERTHGAEQCRQRRPAPAIPIAAAKSGDTIVFDPSLASETITLSSGPLAISSNLTINGLSNQLAISGNNASQLFTLNGTAQVTLDNLTLTGGMASGRGERS